MHEDAVVANHAAYAVAAVALYAVDPEDNALAGHIAEALRSIAEDVRPGVRAAAAYAAGGIRLPGTHAALRTLSEELADFLEDDHYALVRYEWWFGERQAEVDGVSIGIRPEAQTSVSS
jgi:hypothetical protein